MALSSQQTRMKTQSQSLTVPEPLLLNPLSLSLFVLLSWFTPLIDPARYERGRRHILETLLLLNRSPGPGLSRETGSPRLTLSRLSVTECFMPQYLSSPRVSFICHPNFFSRHSMAFVVPNLPIHRVLCVLTDLKPDRCTYSFHSFIHSQAQVWVQRSSLAHTASGLFFLPNLPRAIMNRSWNRRREREREFQARANEPRLMALGGRYKWPETPKT